MNPSTALATVVVDELVLGGVRDAVLSPGSRNAPLSIALHAADVAGRLRLHVRIDERTAGFLALGMAKNSGRPVAVVTTSGTAAVNLHPAVVEAEYAHVPLVVMTADRPSELHGIGANQTIEQRGLYGRSIAYGDDISVDNRKTVGSWRTAIDQVLAHGQRGPVHLNIAFRDPLLPDGDPIWTESLDGPPSEPRVVRGGQLMWAYAPLAAGDRTVVVAGDNALPDARLLAEQGGWPLLAEPSSGHRGGPNAVAAYRLILDRLAPEIDRVVVAGRPTLSRPVSRLLARDDVDVVRLDDDPRTPDVKAAADPSWLASWLTADESARRAMSEVLADEPLNGIDVAGLVASKLPRDALLVAGSSSAVRDLDLATPWEQPPRVLANRGVSGIDGTVSTAIGAALVHDGPAYALMGDLTFLHDSTGLVIGPDEPHPDLTIVVVNDDGGGLFTQLEQGAPEYAGVFERVFGTPHGVDLKALCAASGTAYARAATLDELADQLGSPSGLRVVEAPVDRRRTRDLHERLRSAVADAIS